MPDTAGGLTDLFNLALNTQINILLPTDPGLVDSVILYNYSPYLVLVKTGTASGWLGAWSVDQFRTGQNSVVKCTPIATVGQPPNTGQPTVAQLVGAFVLNDEAQEHQGTYPCTLLGRVGPVSATDLHVIGTQTRIDIEPVPATQPTEYFGTIDRSVQSFINAPSSGSPINFMGLGMNSSPWSSTLAGNPVVHSRVFCALGTLDIGEVKESDQSAIGGRAQFFDDGVDLYFTPGPNSAAATARVRVRDRLISVNNPITPDSAVWNPLVLQNGWVWRGSGFAFPGYRLMPDGTVLLQGQMKNGTTTDGTLLATLPVGYRALADDNFPITSYPGSNDAILEVSPGGGLFLFNIGASPLTVTLGGCRFPII